MKKSRDRVIVFGATGFVGSYLTQALLNKDYQVWAVRRDNSQFVIPVSGENLQCVTWDQIGDVFTTKDKKNWEDIVVFHLAADISVTNFLSSPERFIRKNVDLTFNVVKFLSRLKFQPRLIYLSSDRVYGDARGPLSEGTRTNPVDPYGLSKFFCEEILRIWSLLYSLEVLVVRASNLYGPFQRSSQFVPSLFHRFWKKKNVLEVGNLAVKRDYLYIDDLVTGLIYLAKYSSSLLFDVFHFASGLYFLEEVTSTFEDLAKQKFGRDISFSEDQGRIRPSKSELGDFMMSTKKANTYLGWSPVVSLRQGIEAVFDKEGEIYG